MGFDVPVADALGVDVVDGLHHLPGIEFYDDGGHEFLAFGVFLHDFHEVVGELVHYQVEIEFLWFRT